MKDGTKQVHDAFCGVFMTSKVMKSCYLLADSRCRPSKRLQSGGKKEKSPLHETSETLTS
jgi:hypothetical protein